MPRPSRKAERSEEILDAFERCVARFGVEGATLERTAEEAGLARALIRHNVGNKDALFEAFVDRYLDRSSTASASFFQSLPATERIATLIDWLFDPQYADSHKVQVNSALITAAQERPELAKRLRHWIFDFIDQLHDELLAAYPGRDSDTIRAIATGIAGIYFNADALSPLGHMSSLRRSSKSAVDQLVASLDR